MAKSTIIPYVTMQAQSSLSFTIPPHFLAGECTLPDLWDHHFHHSPTHPLFVFENGGRIEKITWKQAVLAMYRVARSLKPELLSLPITLAHSGKPPVVGLISYQDVPSTWAHIAAVIRLGATVFIISPQNTPEMLANLVQISGCHSLLIADKPSSRNLVQNAVALLPEDYHIKFIHMLDYNQLFMDDNFELDSNELDKRLFDGGMLTPALIIHTSGTTSTPKLVIHSHQSLVQWGQAPYYGDRDLCGVTCGSLSLHLYHMTGITMHIVYPTCSGQTGVVFSPFDPEAPPTANGLLLKSIACGADYIYCVPAFVEEWAKDDDSINLLKEFDVISFAGGRLETTVGNQLASRGVRLCSMWGSSEIGAASRWVFDGSLEDWEYNRLTRQTDIHWEPVEGTNLFEAVVLESPHKLLPESNIQINGRKGFATKDLFEKHPNKPGLWRNCRRGDDVLVHSTGKKTHPEPMERIITQHPLILHAIIFGHSQRTTGLLVEPRENQTDHTRFIDDIWPVIEIANRAVPPYSRILKEMIIVTDPMKPFTLTPKQSLRKRAILADYADQIDSVYQALDESDVQMNGIRPPQSWSLPSILVFIRAVVRKVLALRDEPRDNDDFFQIGADSLHVFIISRSVQQAMKTSDFDTAHLGINFVYSHSSVAKLASYIHLMVSGNNDTPSGLEDHFKLLQNLVVEHTTDFPCHIPTVGKMPNSLTVLITGTTGSLGTHLLAHLIQQSSVNCIYALNRPSHGVQSVRRQELACEAQGFPPSIAHSDKVIYLEGDTSQSGLGLDPTIQKDILKSLTTIFHLAWPVNFNLNVTSFAPSIRSVSCLIEFSLSSPLPLPPDLIFASSVSVIGGWTKDDQIPETIFPYPNYAIGKGYSESKWVAENIILVAQKTTPLRAISVRFGQLLGSSYNGNWTTREWFPSIVCSTQMTRSFPDVEGSISWLPVEIAACVLGDVWNRPEDINCLHAVHPKPITWTSIMEPLAQALEVPLVPFHIWLTTVSASAKGQPSSVTFLLGYFSSLLNRNSEKMMVTGSDTGEVFSGSVYSVKNALLVCGCLRDLKSLNFADFECYLKHWRQSGALE